MPGTFLTLNLSDAVEEIAEAGPELDSALDTFAREIKDERNLGRQPRSSTGIRLPKLPLFRPVLHRLRLPPRLRTGIPATVLRRRGTTQSGDISRIGAELQAGAQHVADSIRARLLDLRSKLQTFHNDFALFAEAVHLASALLSGRRVS